MAMAAEPKTSNEKIMLMGPAKTEFETFMDQCSYFADLYWPDWKNYQNASSYIIPRVFNYLHPDVSDEAIRTANLETIRLAERAAYSSMDRHITDRTSDTAEHLVFTALQQLIEDKVEAPLIVVHNLDIHNNQVLLRRLFPVLDEKAFRDTFKACNREYDFLIIGPHTGIVAIEVKSSKYTAKRDFQRNKLPQGYYDGFQQLKSVDALLEILSICAGIDPPSMFPVRKIIFTPNLERERYETWRNSIENDDDRQKVESSTNGVIQWFTEDMNNSSAYFDKPPLYSTLRIILETGTNGLQKEIFEKFALLTSGIRSMICLGRDFKLNTSHFSHGEAILMEHQRIVEGSPFVGQRNTTPSAHSLMQPIDRKRSPYGPKVISLSPDQQAALEGPARQFIIGVAGTGKTVILQAKALELLSKGEEVVVFSRERYKAQYVKLFNSCGFENYQCFTWPHKEFLPMHYYFETYMDKDFSNGMSTNEVISRHIEYIKDMEHDLSNGASTNEDIMRHICEFVKEETVSKNFIWLNGKNILIDDTCDEQELTFGTRSVNQVPTLFVALSLMTYVGDACPLKTTWTALDPTILNLEFKDNGVTQTYIFRMLMKGLMSNCLKQVGTEPFHVSVLRQVMRCSESVYNIAYSGHRTFQWPNGMEPILAHKIQGLCSVISENEFFESVESAVDRFWEKIEETLDDLSKEGVDMANVGVITGMVPSMLRHQSSIEIANTAIPVFRHDEVSSMEWPVVVYAACLRHNSEDRGHSYEYPRYRALTRATTKSLEITMTYPMVRLGRTHNQKIRQTNRVLEKM